MKTNWKIAVAKDSSVPMLGLHGLHNAFRGLPGVEIVSLFDRNSENGGEAMRFIGAPRHYTDYLEMLDRETPDIVVLCSRHPFDHFPQIQAAAERGVHVYCEKPMTVCLQEADEIIELSNKNRIKICVAHPARYALSFRTMKEMIRSGDIGTPLTVYGRGKCDHRGGGEDLVVLGTHILDLMTFFFGTPESVFADVRVNGRPITERDRNVTVEPVGPVAGDEIFASFRFPGSVRGIFESRKGLFDFKDGVVHMGVTVVGTKGSLSMRFNDNVPVDSNLRVSRTSAPPEDSSLYEEVALKETRVIPGADPLDESVCGTRGIPQKPFFLESNRFAAWDLMQAISEDRQPESNPHNARLAQEMIVGVYAAHLSGGVVKFPLMDRTNPLDHFAEETP